MWEMYEKSLIISRKILNLFLKSECDNRCYVTQAEIGRKLGVSYSIINQHIKKMNWDENRIINTNDKGYVVKHGNLEHSGTYFNIKKLLCDYENNKMMLKSKDKELSEKYDCSLKTVQSFKACVRCGDK